MQRLNREPEPASALGEGATRHRRGKGIPQVSPDFLFPLTNGREIQVKVFVQHVAIAERQSAQFVGVLRTRLLLLADEEIETTYVEGIVIRVIHANRSTRGRRIVVEARPSRVQPQ